MIGKTNSGPKLAGQGAVLLCAVLWSTSGLFIKLVDWHPVVIAGTRSLLAALFLSGIRLLYKPKNRLKNRILPLWAGAFAYAMTMLTFIIANKLTTSANAIVLQYSAPIWAALFGWFLIKEKAHWENWAAIVCIFAGFFMLFRDSSGAGAFMGDCVAILSGVFFGLHSVFLRMQKDGNPLDSMLLAHVISFFVSIPFMAVYPPVLKVSTVFPIIYMGIVQIGFSSILYSYGLKRISAVQAMLTATIEPLLNPVWVLLFTGEIPAVSAIIGCGIILAAVLASAIIGKYREN